MEAADDKWMRVYYRYLYEQKKNYALDFDDLILSTLYILENFPEQLDKWRKRMMYIMVDEYQDIDGQQYQLADLLASYHKNLFVVGDPDQTIYGWRGAEGDRVVHKIFGAGIVKAVDEKNFCYEVAFEKFAIPRSIQFDFPLTKF